jgi:septum formation protein
MSGYANASGDDSAQLVLASGSPRRLEILTGLGIRVRQCPVDVDETVRPGESAEALVHRLALAKAEAGRARGAGGLPVLGADTVVALDGRVLGKPAGRDDAIGMLLALSGCRHEVLSGVAVADGEGVRVRISRSIVRFRDLSRSEAELYWATGEPRDKAGAYGIQGVGGIFVSHLEGSFSGVMGLPVVETEELLRMAGVDCWRHRITGGNR